MALLRLGKFTGRGLNYTTFPPTVTRINNIDYTGKPANLWELMFDPIISNSSPVRYYGIFGTKSE